MNKQNKFWMIVCGEILVIDIDINDICFIGKWKFKRDHLITTDSKRPNICLVTVWLPSEHLWSHVQAGARLGARPLTGEL